ncbi:UDP-glucuronic acid decarboxylase family protein [Patescibacteria group bacterium]
MKILITGGAGFIGSHLCKKLHSQGHTVICVDNLLTGSRDNLGDYEFIEHDINESIEIECDQIYNLACPASPIQYQKNPILTMRTNVNGSMNMLDLAKANDARILQASTSEVYGDPSEHPQSETYNGNVNCTGPRACYDEGKRAAESLFFDYSRKRGVDVRVVRIFNTYGPNMLKDDGRVISNFIIQALNGEDLTIYGDGSQTRSFQYVDDLVDGMIAMMEGDFIGPCNLGNPNEISINELAQKIIELTDSTSQIINAPLPEDDPIKRKPNIEQAQKNLNWQPKTALNEGLQKTVEYFKSL